MATPKKLNDTISLNSLVELFGFPTLPELIIDGVNMDETLYRKLVVRLAQHYLDTVHLTLSLAGEDVLKFEPFAGGDWNDAAYWLGNLVNQEAGTAKVAAPSDLLRLGRQGGGTHDSLAEAVLSNLHYLKSAPGVFGMGTPGDALRKAAENALEVKKVREMVYEEAAGW
jgi:hypothetical protein